MLPMTRQPRFALLLWCLVALLPSYNVQAQQDSSKNDSSSACSSTITNNNNNANSCVATDNDDGASSSVRNQCRRVPSWMFSDDAAAVSSETCASVFAYTVPDVLKDASPKYQKEPREWQSVISDCMREAREKRCGATTTTTNQANECSAMSLSTMEEEPEITKLYPAAEHDDGSEWVVATVSRALNPFEAAEVQDLAACLRTHLPEEFEQQQQQQRPTLHHVMEGHDDDERGGGNSVTFLSGFLQHFLPGVAAQIKHVGHLVWERAQWTNNNHTSALVRSHQDFIDPLQAGIRTSEHHLSHQGGWSQLGEHDDDDHGSLYTIVVALADGDEYEGGEFFFRQQRQGEDDDEDDGDDEKITTIKPERLMAIVFQSELNHGVQKIVKGAREMFSTELWMYDDVGMGMHRPQYDEVGEDHDDDGNSDGNVVSDDDVKEEIDSTNQGKITRESRMSDEERMALKKLRDNCRRFPTWRPTPNAKDVSIDSCVNASGYDPERNDVIHGADYAYTRRGTEWAMKIITCIGNATDHRCAQGKLNCVDSENIPVRDPQVTGMYPSAEKPVFATVDFALSDREAALVQDLAACVRQHPPSPALFEKRDFAYNEKLEADGGQGGGNDVTFMAGFLQIFAPGVAGQIFRLAHMVWEKAGWGNVTVDGFNRPVEYPDPYTTGIRTTEHLSYDKWGKLARHTDSESLYTVLVALANPTDYEGGAYYIVPARTRPNSFRISLKPNRLSAIVFISEEEHGVEQILSGRREMFTTELWAYPDVTIGVRRPSISDYHRFVRKGHWWLDPGDEGYEE